MKKTKYYSLITVICASTLLFSGCRLGNHSDPAKPIPYKESYLSKEYFGTTSKSFETKASYTDSNGVVQTVTNPTTPLSAVPSKVLDVFTNPHVFAVVDNAARTPIFVNYYWDTFYETKIENGNTIAYEASSAPGTFMYDPACTSRIEMVMDGFLDRSHPTTMNMGGSTGIINIAGRTNMDFHFSRRIEGNCADDLYVLAYCYSNGAGCSNEELTFSHDILDLYVNQSGILNINDVLKLKTLEYTVHLE